MSETRWQRDRGTLDGISGSHVGETSSVGEVADIKLRWFRVGPKRDSGMYCVARGSTLR